MSSVNRVIIVGNLGREAKIDQFESFDIVEKIVHERMNESDDVDAPYSVARPLASIAIVDAKLSSTPKSVGTRHRTGNRRLLYNSAGQYRLR
jgi:hypothetical protein